MIELAILGILKEAELHGYELKKHLRKVLGPLSNVSFGSLYPALKRLERQGAVAVVAIDDGPERASMPLTGSLTGEAAAFRARHLVTRGPRNKKVYGITAVGDARLRELMADPADDERSFGMKLAFFRLCDRPTRLNLLERRRTTLRQRLDETRRAVAREGDDPYVRALMEHDSESTMRDIDWIGRLIASEQEQAAGDGRDKEPTGGHP
ncbi:PadR family transcriptional regulator [soil metagenome]